MLRESVRKKTALGRKAKGYIETGALVPDRLVDAIVKARLARKDCENGFVLMGTRERSLKRSSSTPC